MNYKQINIAFIGGGNMAQAIIRGLIAADHPPENISAADPDPQQRAAISNLAAEIDVQADNSKILSQADAIVLAVKPQIMAAVASKLADTIRIDTQLIVSIAAGITLQSLRGWFGEAAQLVRVMPNQPALVGQGMSGLCATEAVDAEGRDLAGYILRAAGRIRWFAEESRLDPVTAISGSGPAYYYLIMEILQEVAEEFGFDPDTARLMSVQTALGASEVAADSDTSLATLREQVTSPGGTTAAALTELEAAGIRAIFRKALYAARDRSIELGRLADPD